MILNSSNLLENKVALITGANRGIGFEIAKKYLNHGAIVYCNARKEGSLDKLSNSVQNSDKLIPLYFDIREASSVKQAFLRINKEQKRLDCLVNNAGIMKDALLGMISKDLMKELFEINVYATLDLMQYASKLMKRNKSGSIINMSSIVGVKGSAGQVAYSATKGAVISLTKAASKELSPSNIRVNAIAPGIVNTDLLSGFSSDKKEELRKSIGLARLASTSDVAGTAVYLASDMSSYVTGQTIEVEGSLLI